MVKDANRLVSLFEHSKLRNSKCSMWRDLTERGISTLRAKTRISVAPAFSRAQLDVLPRSQVTGVPTH